MASTTVSELLRRVSAITNELSTLLVNIKNHWNTAPENKELPAQIRAMMEKKSSLDRMFEEEQSKSQASGGKTRKQTLQEFVLMFFFVAYFVLTISMMLFTFPTGDAPKIFGIMLFGLLIICGMIIRYT